MLLLILLNQQMSWDVVKNMLLSILLNQQMIYKILRSTCMKNACESIHILLKHVQQSFNKSNQVHRDGDWVSQGEHETNGSPKFRACYQNWWDKIWKNITKIDWYSSKNYYQGISRSCNRFLRLWSVRWYWQLTLTNCKKKMFRLFLQN